MTIESASVIIRLDPITSAVLRRYALQRAMTREEAIAALLYRQAAVMTGWPGGAGRELEEAMLAEARPTDAGEDIGEL